MNFPKDEWKWSRNGLIFEFKLELKVFSSFSSSVAEIKGRKGCSCRMLGRFHRAGGKKIKLRLPKFFCMNEIDRKRERGKKQNSFHKRKMIKTTRQFPRFLRLISPFSHGKSALRDSRTSFSRLNLLLPVTSDIKTRLNDRSIDPGKRKEPWKRKKHYSSAGDNKTKCNFSFFKMSAHFFHPGTRTCAIFVGIISSFFHMSNLRYGDVIPQSCVVVIIVFRLICQSVIAYLWMLENDVLKVGNRFVQNCTSEENETRIYFHPPH